MKKIVRTLLAATIIFFANYSFAQTIEDREHRINVNEILDISVYQEADLSKTIMVSSDGTINYPLIGTICIQGLTTKEVEEKIAKLLEKDYLVNPQVTVLVKEYAKVYVLGQVHRPGTCELKAGLTVVGAIAMAGGLTEEASPNGVKVIRISNDRKKVIPVPVGDILKGSAKDEDIVLEPNDTIVVPESFF